MIPLHYKIAQDIAKHFTRANWYAERIDNDMRYTAVDPDLPGCRGDGYSLAEALEQLALARIDYIWSMIDDGIIPDSVLSGLAYE